MKQTLLRFAEEPAVDACARSISGALLALVVSVMGLLGGRAVASMEPEVDPWQRTLESFVVDGGVDYSALALAPTDLRAFLESLGEAVPPSADLEATAFWMNAYNALVLHHVLEYYPIASVMDVDGFFDELRFEVGGEDLTLDEIEGRALEPGGPRVHFALVCAAQSCPPLRNEAYTGAILEEQLDDQTRRFLADPSKGARLDSEERVLWLSSLFKWYGGEFTNGSRAMAYLRRSRVVEWARPYFSEAVRDEIDRRDLTVRYLAYDWGLNDRQREETP